MQLRLGTRGSPLALVQAGLVRDALCTAHGWAAAAVEIVVIRTTGDRIQDRALAEIGGKALWTREIDRALLDGVIDGAVHSMKDVETIRPPALALAAMLPRGDVRDRLICSPAIGTGTIDLLPPGARVGTSSPRRSAQLRRLRPDLAITLLRGNVGTRLASVAAGDVDATLLAAAGLDRLGRIEGTPIPATILLPAPAQGAIGVEVRGDDAHAAALFGAIDHAATHRCVGAERALLAALHADCHSPVAALAMLDADRLILRAELLSADGGARVDGAIEAPADRFDHAALLAGDLLRRAPLAVARLFAAMAPRRP